ncbi:M6 family metalloprotease domain-containing protein [Fibrobacter sp. UWB16]|nr:M6 family metalloprotease domain-containing protein [Fibrobacter sp. UWB16]
MRPGVTQAVWPHMGRLLGPLWSEDRRINYYSCANEISSNAYAYDHSTTALEGIGVFVHEFSHLLGLMDWYDSGKNSGRESAGYWSVMAYGDNLCPSNSDRVTCCAPVLYSTFEKMSMGWLTPVELGESGPLRLDKIDENVAYSVTNPNNPDEAYYLEYRSKKGWDVDLPNSGMLIWHIDYDASVWSDNEINSNGDHMHADVIEAVPRTSGYGSSSDPFPGSGKVTEFNKFVFWDGKNANIALSSIKESGDHEYVLFNVCMNASTCPTIEWSSSSVKSSSSEEVESSSSEALVGISTKIVAQGVRVSAKNGSIYVYAPQKGRKIVRVFSPIGSLLLERAMDGSEMVVNDEILGKMGLILSVSQGNNALFTGTIDMR